MLSFIILVACNNNEQIKTAEKVDTLKTTPETLNVTKEAEPEVLLPKTYSNKHFRDVTVEREGQEKF